MSLLPLCRSAPVQVHEEMGRTLVQPDFTGVQRAEGGIRWQGGPGGRVVLGQQGRQRGGRRGIGAGRLGHRGAQRVRVDDVGMCVHHHARLLHRLQDLSHDTEHPFSHPHMLYLQST